MTVEHDKCMNCVHTHVNWKDEPCASCKYGAGSEDHFKYGTAGYTVCSECGAVITDKRYLKMTEGQEIKFCSMVCVLRGWKRGVYEYNKRCVAYEAEEIERTRAPSKPLTPAEGERILKWHEKGYSAIAVSKMVNRSYSTVWRVIRAASEYG